MHLKTRMQLSSSLLTPDPVCCRRSKLALRGRVHTQGFSGGPGRCPLQGAGLARMVIILQRRMKNMYADKDGRGGTAGWGRTRRAPAMPGRGLPGGRSAQVQVASVRRLQTHYALLCSRYRHNMLNVTR